ncbi:hypothetical protein HCJ46_10370 [Listeria booriae]|uniref:hypothetical protein n=1 Tax=Listeria booriae TaxID=1552123 RepID=UPI001623E77C|nr:hypothetical protein [Listeria booriae]MBC1919166.1 hypothetical protein [Listeria booriae]
MAKLFFMPANSKFYEGYSMNVREPMPLEMLEERILEAVALCANSMKRFDIEFHYPVSSEESKTGEPFELVFISDEPEDESCLVPLHYLGCTL